MVGAVGIENNTKRNLNDLEEMQGSTKVLKRNNRECKGILIGPLKAPRFSRCGWQAGDCTFPRNKSRTDTACCQLGALQPSEFAGPIIQFGIDSPRSIGQHEVWGVHGCFRVGDNTLGMCGARTGPSCAARGVSSFTGDEGVLRGQDFPVAVALFKDVFQVSP